MKTEFLDAPEITLEGEENAGEVLLKFYSALGWNREDSLDPCKVITTDAIWNGLYDLMIERISDTVAVGMHMVNSGPSVRENIPPGKVCLLPGWIVKEQENCDLA